MKVNGVEIDIDKPVLCPGCGEELQVWLPILVTPGSDTVDTDMIDWEAAVRHDHWTCGECDFDGFPENYSQERMQEIMSKDKDDMTSREMFIIEVEGPGGLL